MNGLTRLCTAPPAAGWSTADGIATTKAGAILSSRLVRRARLSRRPLLQLLHLAAAIVLLTAGDARAAADRTDVTVGQELSRAWCSECHQVEPGRILGPYSNVPSFTEIAGQSSSTAASIRAFLATPHPTMPNLKLTPAETDEIVAYILSLYQP
jgi:mono/diheme cytochrome c family protein